MDKVFAVIRREYLERVRSRWFVVATLFGPLLFGALMIVPSVLASRERGSTTGGRVEILDVSGTGLGSRLAEHLAGGVSDANTTNARSIVRRLDVAALAEAESLATRAVIDKRIDGYLVVDSTTLATGRARYAGSNTTAIFAMQRLQQGLQRELLTFRIEQSGVDPELGRALANTQADIRTERLTEKGRGGSGQVNFIVGFAVAMLMYLVTFIYGLNVLRGVLEEKQTRVAEVVIASIPAPRLLLGKVIGVGGVGLTQLVLWMIMSFVMWQVRRPLLARFGVDAAPFAMPDVGFGLAIVLLAFFVLGFFLYAGLFAAAGASVSSEQEAQQAQMPIVLLLVSSIMFAQNILMQPDGGLARTLSLLPHSASIVMPLRMTVSQVPPAELAMALVSVAIGGALSVWLAGRIYRVGLLMYGKRPTLPELWRWVRAR
jgi:ABC-2 type transport system permease protein